MSMMGVTIVLNEFHKNGTICVIELRAHHMKVGTRWAHPHPSCAECKRSLILSNTDYTMHILGQYCSYVVKMCFYTFSVESQLHAPMFLLGYTRLWQ